MASSLYWIGRYVERAEQTARLTEATFSHTLAMGSTPEAEARRERHWAALLETVGTQPTFTAEHGPPDDLNVPEQLIFSTENANSIVECIALARDNARTMRHQVATEMWEALNRFQLEVHNPARRRTATADAETATRFCRSVVDFSQRLQGITDSTMPREEGFYFLRAGSSSNAPSRPPARWMSTTGCSQATVSAWAAPINSPWLPRPRTSSRGRSSSTRSRPTSPITASSAGGSSRRR